MIAGRLKGSFQTLVRGALPDVVYKGLYRARVLRQHENLVRVDVQPEHPDLPPMSNIPLRVGVPGVRVRFRFTDEAGRGTGPRPYVLVGWEAPDLPFATLFEPSEKLVPRETIAAITVEAMTVELGAGGLVAVQDGVVTGQGKDPYTGLPYWMLGASSSVVGAAK